MPVRNLAASILLTATSLLTSYLPHAAAQTAPTLPYDPALYSDLRWRCIGPYRGGRTVAITGVSEQPGVFYMAQVNGGVWKTDDFGNTWNPIFDDQSSGSVGAIAVAPSDPNIVYVGSGEGLQRPDLAIGDGMYKSTDAGRSLSPSKATPTAPASNAASFAPPTVAPPSKKFSTRTKTPGRPTSPSIHKIP
jgi:hypothetical protein